jgi:hypothetical protein
MSHGIQLYKGILAKHWDEMEMIKTNMEQSRWLNMQLMDRLKKWRV